MKIEFRNVAKSYGATTVIDGLSLEIAPDEFFFLLGASGCGKTTLLRMIAGFIAPDSGEVLFDGRPVNNVPPERRQTPMVFQSYALWPHLSVFENVAYGLRLQPLSRREVHRQATEALETARMRGFENRFPNQLSGGQQQRVAIARALAVHPRALLFDEPLSNLDAKLRVEMRQELLEIHRRRPFTAVYVTHDQEEAMTMATRIAVLDRGRIRQVGAPQDVYARPTSRFVAEFMGPVNWFPARVKESLADGMALLDTPFGGLRARLSLPAIAAGQSLSVGFRPFAARPAEDIASSGEPTAAAVASPEHEMAISCEILQAQYSGDALRLSVRPRSGSPAATELRFQVIEVNPRKTRKSGAHALLKLAVEDMMILAEP